MSTTGAIVIEMRDISIEFPGVKALQNVNCSFTSGHIKALVGANGAGKSTLMKILSGVNDTYTGEVLINGERVEIRSPITAKKLGIEIVYQEVDTVLAPSLTVGENIMMEHMVYGMGKKLFVNWKYLHRAAGETLARLNMSIDTTALVSTLTLAQKQMVVIARAIRGNCRFLILDEPTAPLSQSETQKLFEVVRQLKEGGVGVIFISHRLNELFEICENITVLRDGKLVDSFELNETVSMDAIVEKMLGSTFDNAVDKTGCTPGEALLQVENLADSQSRIHDINLTLRRGEIVGIAGLVGAGKTELCKTLFGVYGKPAGKMEISGRAVAVKSAAEAVAAGMAFIPEERRKEGVLVAEPVYSNLSLATLSGLTNAFSFINKKRELRNAQAKVDSLNIKTPTLQQRVALLSGGNQQKVAIGKWLDSSADIYIFDEPTKGIDVGAKGEVYKLIVALARQGKGILYATSEQNEILMLSDRTYVMYDGTIQKEFVTAETNEEQLMFYSTGGTDREN